MSISVRGIHLLKNTFLDKQMLYIKTMHDIVLKSKNSTTKSERKLLSYKIPYMVQPVSTHIFWTIQIVTMIQLNSCNQLGMHLSSDHSTRYRYDKTMKYQE